MDGRNFLKQSVLGVVASALMLPGALAFATVLLVITGPAENMPRSEMWNSFLNRSPGRACLYGTVLGIGFCILLGIALGKRFSRADLVSAGPYDELRRRLDRAKTRYTEVSPPEASSAAAEAYAEANEHLEHLVPLLEDPSRPDSRWLRGTGYLDAWRRLHQGEEALMFLESLPLLLARAFNDEARLVGSSIPQRTALLARLRRAVSSLSASAASYLSEPAPPQDPRHRTALPPDQTQGDTDDARAALVQVRSAIDDFRDGRREGIIRARNRLFVTVVFAGLTGCILLDVAILAGAPKRSIVAVTAFYLVGGTVGLFRQLQVASASEGARQDDYGLGNVRLVHTPLFSGLAAVGGVVLVQLSQGKGVFSLPHTFDVHQNAYGLVAAAIFGLAPSLLFSGLQQRVDQYQTDLSKSDAGQAPAAAVD
jgi:hypothetical protein